MSNEKKTPIHELGTSKEYEKAKPGYFRACVMIDSCIYHIGEDQPDRESAFILCSEYRGMDTPVQIFDDKGECHIIKGELKIIYKDQNSFLNNAVSFFDKIMKQTYITKKKIIQLKRQLGHLKEQDGTYKSLFNKVTNIANKAKGKNDPEILQDVYKTFKELKLS